jgi:hypothetical protein
MRYTTGAKNGTPLTTRLRTPLRGMGASNTPWTGRAGSYSLLTIMSSFRTLEKVILSKEQLTAFKSSKTYAKITSYIGTLNDAVVESKLTDECAQSQVRPIPLGSRISLFYRVAHWSEVA